MAIYVPAAYLDGAGDLWWLVLEKAIAAATRIDVEVSGTRFQFVTETADEKTVAFHKVYWALRALPEREMRAKVREIAQAAGYDAASLCRELIMTWDEVRRLPPIPSLPSRRIPSTILPSPNCRRMRRVTRSPKACGAWKANSAGPVATFSFPYGDATSAGPRDFEIARSLGLATAVTTHKDVIDGVAPDFCGLPRVSLNGNFQRARYVRVFLSGAPFALVRFAKRVKAVLRGRGASSQAASTAALAGRTA